MKTDDRKFIKRAIEIAIENVQSGKGGPFGALVVKDGEIIAESTNSVVESNDPTAHAEVNAIRAACQKLNDFQLKDCTIYSSCEPCPMCLGAIYWARPSRLVFGATKKQASEAGFDDSFIYKEISIKYKNRQIITTHFKSKLSQKPFDLWLTNTKKTAY